MKTATILEIARSKNVTRQAIEYFRDMHRIKPVDKRGRTDLYHVSDFAMFGKTRKDKTEWRDLWERERAVKLEIANAKSRGELVDRALIAQVFGEIFSIHRGVLLNIGPGLSDTVAAIADADEAGKTLKIQELVDNEIYGALSAIKSVINAFLRRVEAEEITDDLPEPQFATAPAGKRTTKRKGKTAGA